MKASEVWAIIRRPIMLSSCFFALSLSLSLSLESAPALMLSHYIDRVELEHTASEPASWRARVVWPTLNCLIHRAFDCGGIPFKSSRIKPIDPVRADQIVRSNSTDLGLNDDDSETKGTAAASGASLAGPIGGLETGLGKQYFSWRSASIRATGRHWPHDSGPATALDSRRAPPQRYLAKLDKVKLPTIRRPPRASRSLRPGLISREAPP